MGSTIQLRKEHPLWLILAIFFILATAYSVINPIHEGTDELRHYRFVRYIVQYQALPVQGEEPCRSQSHHPPLIYALGALATAGIDTGRDVCDNPIDNPFWGYNYWEVGTDNKNMYMHSPAEAFPWSGEALAAHIVRLINVLFGGLTVLFTYLTARVLWPRYMAYAAGAAAFVAFNPQFLYMSGTINNDVVAAASGGAIILAAALILQNPNGIERPDRTGIWLGVVYAFALLSKLSLAPFGLIFELALIVTAFRYHQWREWWRANIFMGGISLLLAGWWFLRNLRLYGDLTGFETVTELWGAREPGESWGLLWQELPNLWSSLWGRFGFGQIPLPEGVYRFLWGGVTLIAAAGIIMWLWLRIMDWQANRDYPLILHRQKGTLMGAFLLVLTAMIAAAVVASYILVSPAGAMGRFLFPGLPAFAILLFWGVSRWVWVVTRQSTEESRSAGMLRLAFVNNVMMGGLATVALVGYLAPAYAPPQSWTADTIPADAMRSGVTFEPWVRLHAYEVHQESVRPGERVAVTVYWEVLAQPIGDYYLFAHFTDEIDSMVAQRDTHPGLGRFPAGQWQAGDRFVDTIYLDVPETAYLGSADLSIGLYAPGSYRLPVVDPVGEMVGDRLILGSVDIVNRSEPFPNPLDVSYGDRVKLVGYEFNTREIESGDQLDITLYWETIDANVDGLVSYVDVMGSDGHNRRSDNSLQKRVTIAGSGQLIIDTHSFTIDEAVSTGNHAISLHLFDIFTEKRVLIIADGGNWVDNDLRLAQVRVR